jgi:hypothetical protein
MGKPKPKPLVAVVRHDRDGYIRCRVCGCTEREPCNPPCSWVRGEPDLCTSCEKFIMSMVEWLNAAHQPSRAALQREVKRSMEPPW